MHCAQNIQKLTKTNTPTLTDICSKEVVHIREIDNAVPIWNQNIAIVFGLSELGCSVIHFCKPFLKIHTCTVGKFHETH